MSISIEVLNSTHTSLLHKFSCKETLDELGGKKSKERRVILSRSEEIDYFIKREALPEQEASLNITHLFIDTDVNEIIGFVSLCNDSIPLALEERQKYKEIVYSTVPAIKIARLGVNNKFHKKGVGTLIVQYCAFVASEMRKTSGITFITLDCYKHRKSFYEEKFGFVVNNVAELNRINSQSPISMRLHLSTYLKKINKEL